MENIDYKKLYELQDICLNIIFKNDTEFYLTGGTCLSRFYFEKRYSNDLDFFTNFSNTFHNSIRTFTSNLLKEKISFTVKTDSKDFVRILVEDFLQIDFVNDRVKYFGKPEIRKSFKIDNLKNILSNKLTAIISRDNAKDIFDIYLISKFTKFNWKNIVRDATEKMVFELSELISRLDSFPEILILNLDFIDPDFLKNFTSEFKVMSEDIGNLKENSLCQK